MNNTSVTIEKSDNQTACTINAINNDLKEIVKPGDNVILKVNQVDGLPPDKGSTISPNSIDIVARLILEAGAKDVAIAEDCGAFSDTTNIFKKLGTDVVAKKLGLKLLNLRKEPYKTVRISDPLVPEASSLQFSLPLLECDKLISLTKLKTHHQAGYSCALKNMYGAIADKYKRLFHRCDLEEAIIDINSVRKADYSIVDGFPGMEGIGPHIGEPVPINIVIAGEDPVAVDVVCATIMGFNLQDVRQLKAAKKKNLGISDLDKIYIKGVPIVEVFRPFKTALEKIQSQLEGYVSISGIPCTGCSGVVGTTFMLLLGRNRKRPEDFKETTICTGKNVLKDQKKPGKYNKFIFTVGDCACKEIDYPIKIRGCPPTITQFMEKISPTHLGLTKWGRNL
ncbi:hypothetical protein ES705_01616 [subsurface metagenome]|nr:DUF362 domain-containing protein [Clostridia bacterium]